MMDTFEKDEADDAFSVVCWVALFQLIGLWLATVFYTTVSSALPAIEFFVRSA